MIIETTADELKTLVMQLAANPADGPVRISVDEGTGSLVSEWVSHGNPTKVGPAITRPLS